MQERARSDLEELDARVVERYIRYYEARVAREAS